MLRRFPDSLLRLCLIAVLLFICGTASAQLTRVRGRVMDADTGEALPYVALFFKGTSDGASTDNDGRFVIITDSPAADTVVCWLLGYQTIEAPVRNEADTLLFLQLHPEKRQLSEAVVKPDNRLARRLLRGIDSNRGRNNPDARPSYKCKVYSKEEIDLMNARERIKDKRILDEFGFVFDYADTSSVDGRERLPVMFSETVAERWHTSNPESDVENVLANHISGVNRENNLLSQFTGSIHLRANFYKDFINSFGVNFPSPAQKNGLLYYDYFIVDTLLVDGRRTYQVRYHPKKGTTSPAFDGEMMVDAVDFGLRSVHARMKQGSNVNWLRDLILDTEYSRGDDSLWFFSSDNLYADFSLDNYGPSKIMTFAATRSITYSDADFAPTDIPDAAGGPVRVASDANFKDDEYWEAERPARLSDSEAKVESMVEKVQQQPLYKTLYTLGYTLATGYVDIGPIGIGPVLKMISFNRLEGFRPQIGIHTSKDLSQKFRWTAYCAYGTADRQFKGGLSYEHMFNREKTRKLTLSASYDEYQLGKGKRDYTSGNILSSFWSAGQKPSPMTSFSALYEHEFSQNVNAQAEVGLKRLYSNAFVPMKGRDGQDCGSVASNEARLQLRFSKDETVSRGYFEKTYVHSYHPVITLDLTASVPGLRRGDVGYFRPELSLDYDFNVPPLGRSRLHVNAGTILGQVPYPMLHIHAGNVTGLLDRTSFSCMEYMEFASDSWATLYYDHNFNGLLLGWIPLLQKLQLREVVILKAAVGSLSEKNDGTAGGKALMLFPDGMQSLGSPYVEAGAGLSNILNLFRVDFIWRLTHRETARRNFMVNFGMELRF